MKEAFTSNKKNCGADEAINTADKNHSKEYEDNTSAASKYNQLHYTDHRMNFWGEGLFKDEWNL